MDKDQKTGADEALIDTVDSESTKSNADSVENLLASKLKSASSKTNSNKGRSKFNFESLPPLPGDGRRLPLSIKINQRLVAGVIVLIVLCGASGFAGGWLADKNDDSRASDSSSLALQKKVVTSEGELINTIAKEVGQSVVSVNVTSQQPSVGFFGDYNLEQASAGTGIIITSDGLIMTNRHVVPEGTTDVSVTLSDGTELKDVKVVGRTSSSDTLDVAFLKINDLKGHKLIPATLGDSSKVQVGDTVVAIGNALGQFQNTVTSGIISGFGRSVQASSGSNSRDSESLDNLFQTDAAINSGNSGGPLVNTNGEVIGINTAIAESAQNIGFAIPINDVKGLVRQVTEKGKLERPYLGIRYIALTDDYAYQLNLDTKRGAYIAPSSDGPSVIPGSPADKAGLKEKDIITAINDHAIDQSHSLTSVLGQFQPGDKLKLTVVRDGKTISVSVTLGTAPQS
jgi:serine protease Do